MFNLFFELQALTVTVQKAKMSANGQNRDAMLSRMVSLHHLPMAEVVKGKHQSSGAKHVHLVLVPPWLCLRATCQTARKAPKILRTEQPILTHLQLEDHPDRNSA